MSLNDPLANVLSKVYNAEKIGRKVCQIKPVSKLITNILKILKENKYIGGFEKIEDGKGDYIEVQLIGKINKCGAIKPRYPVKLVDIEKFEKRYLPAKDFGLIIISTPKGIMTHIESRKKKMGGRLIAYCY